MTRTIKDLTTNDLTDQFKGLTDQFNTKMLDKALFIAAREGQLETVRYLLDRGVDPNAGKARDASPLASAAQGGHTEIVSLLLDRGATKGLREALWRATKSGHADVVLLLLETKRDALSDDDVRNARYPGGQDERASAAALLLDLERNVIRVLHTSNAPAKAVTQPAP
jgi:ankyrin repeat protein